MFPAFVEIGSTVEQKTALVLHLSSMSISGGFYMVDCSPFILMFSCPIVVFIDFQDSTLMIFSARPGYVFRNPFLMALTRTSIDGLNIDACKYCASYGFDVCTRMLFVTAASC